MLDGSASVETGQVVPANRKPVPPEHTRFKAGQSGNPRGRPKKDLDLAAMAQRHAELAVQTLAQCLTDPEANWPSKVSAASELLDRGFGRAPQSLNVDHKVGFSEQFEAFIRELSGKKPAVIEHVETLEALPLAPDSDGIEAAPPVRDAAE